MGPLNARHYRRHRRGLLTKSRIGATGKFSSFFALVHCGAGCLLAVAAVVLILE